MFANRIAIITGGGSGIGRAAAQLIAKQGGSVIVADQSLANAKETVSLLGSGQQQQHLALEVDVSKSDSVNHLFNEVPKAYGSGAVATLLANCAGITRDGWMIDMSEEAFSKVMDVNVKGTFLTTQAACKRIVDSKSSNGGSIVNFSSVSAKIANLGQVNYVASKCAVEGLTRTVAREMGRHNIRCNAIIPGFIDTPMIRTVPEKVMEGIKKQTPLGRCGQAEEVAKAIAFFLSDQSSYVTGSLLHVSGGFAV